jgi:hypothetical protein
MVFIPPETLAISIRNEQQAWHAMGAVSNANYGKKKMGIQGPESNKQH